MLLDGEQVRQMLVNLVQNGIDAVEATAASGAGTWRASVSVGPFRVAGPGACCA